MKPRKQAPLLAPVALLVVLLLGGQQQQQQVLLVEATSPVLLREEVRAMFGFGYDSYMLHAYPADELNPLECTGRGPDKAHPENININDVLGDFSMTLIDTLDTHVVMGNVSEFHSAARRVMLRKSFDIDSLVSVFEVTIRVLGGLLSGHLATTLGPFREFWIPGYQNELLNLAYDLGKRILPAFENTRTGLPFPRVNLRYGITNGIINQTCTAGAGTLLLEFATLSRLTGDTRFERVAKRALHALWSYRSQLDLLGNVIDIQTGQWVQPESGVGAGIDSYFEYALKSYVLLGEQSYLDLFTEAYGAVNMHVRDDSKYIYRNVHMDTGVQLSSWVDSLGAFLPGLQVLHGDISAAERGHEIYYALWRKYGSLPERFDFVRRDINIAVYPLRPELAESTYYLYRATRDPYYLAVGEVLVRDLQRYSRTTCGYATLRNVVLKVHEDRMESFFLSETLKYLYLLFDEGNVFNRWDDNWVFTTEGHLVHVPPRSAPTPAAAIAPATVGRTKPKQQQQQTCPRPAELSLPASWNTYGTLGMRPQHHSAISRLVGFENGVPMADTHVARLSAPSPSSGKRPRSAAKQQQQPPSSPAQQEPAALRKQKQRQHLLDSINSYQQQQRDQRICAPRTSTAVAAQLLAEKAGHPWGQPSSLSFHLGPDQPNLLVAGRAFGLTLYTNHGLELTIAPDAVPSDWSDSTWSTRSGAATQTCAPYPSTRPLVSPYAFMCPLALVIENDVTYSVLKINGLPTGNAFALTTIVSIINNDFPAVPAQVVLSVDAAGAPGQQQKLAAFGAFPSLFSLTPCEIEGGVTGRLVVLDSSVIRACKADVLPELLVRGAVVVAERGGCMFSEKASNLEAKGAVAVIIVNKEDIAFHMSGPGDNEEGERHALSSMPTVQVPRSRGIELYTLAAQHANISVHLS